MSDPIRELKIAKEQLASLRTEFATQAELYESQRKILHTVAAERDAAIQRAEAAEQALRMNAGSKGSTTVMMSLDRWTLHLAEVEHFGADQWRNGNAGREPQEFLEWRQEQAADRHAAFNGGEI